MGNDIDNDSLLIMETVNQQLYIYQQLMESNSNVVVDDLEYEDARDEVDCDNRLQGAVVDIG